MKKLLSVFLIAILFMVSPITFSGKVTRHHGYHRGHHHAIHHHHHARPVDLLRH